STNSKSGSRPYKAHAFEEQDIDNEEESFALFTMFSSSEPIHKDLQINGVNIKFQLDIGAFLSVMNRDTFSRVINAPLKPSSKVLKTYTGEAVRICGEAVVDVRDDKLTVTLPLVVVEKGGPPLLGRDWLSALGINLGLNRINHDCPQTLEQVLESYGSVFKSSAGCLRGTKVKLYTSRALSSSFAGRDSLPMPCARQSKK
ncbi:polyprotein, partial [Elysia marginata]